VEDDAAETGLTIQLRARVQPVEQARHFGGSYVIASSLYASLDLSALNLPKAIE
jgi:hypothetical protein